MIGKYFSKFVNDEIGMEYANKILREGSGRWNEMGFLSEREAEDIVGDQKIMSIACNFGVHAATGALAPTGTGLSSLFRCFYTLAKRRHARSRKDEAMANIHAPLVALFALIPVAGNFSYPLIHLGGRSKALGIFVDQSLGTPIARRFENKPLIGRVTKPYYRFIRSWFNDEPLFGFIERRFKGNVDGAVDVRRCSSPLRHGKGDPLNQSDQVE